MNKLGLYLKRSDKPTTIEWIMASVMFLGFFVIYIYFDICETAPSSLNIWNGLFGGNILDFYSMHYEGVVGSYIPNGVTGGAYDFLLYVIFAIYNFPLWIYEKLTGTSFLLSYLGRVYMKSILIVFMILSAWILGKIVKVLTENENLPFWTMFLFLYSEIAANTIVVIGGYDILSVFFTLAGLYFYLKNDNKKFVFFFAVAVVCKMFALWVYVPLVLLREKKIHRIFLYGLGSVSLVIIPKLLMAGLNLFRTTEEVRSNAVIAHSGIINDKLFMGSGAPISLESIPLFFVALFLLWWICWKKEKATDYEVIFVCLVSMSIFFLFADTMPYWIILLLPYVVLVMVLNPSGYQDNVILEGIFSIGFILYSACTARQCYNMHLLVYMLKPARLPVKGEMDYIDFGFSSLVERLSLKVGISYENIASLFLTCFTVGLILFLYKNHPGQQNGELDIQKVRVGAWVRVALGICIAMLPVLGLVEGYIALVG